MKTSIKVFAVTILVAGCGQISAMKQPATAQGFVQVTVTNTNDPFTYTIYKKQGTLPAQLVGKINPRSAEMYTLQDDEGLYLASPQGEYYVENSGKYGLNLYDASTARKIKLATIKSPATVSVAIYPDGKVGMLDRRSGEETSPMSLKQLQVNNQLIHAVQARNLQDVEKYVKDGADANALSDALTRAEQQALNKALTKPERSNAKAIADFLRKNGAR